jgi:hypothetical protein
LDLFAGVALRAEEEKRDRAQREGVAKFRSLLVDGPTLEIPMDGAQFGFDPDAVVPLGDAGTGYPSLDVTGPWGRITTTPARASTPHKRSSSSPLQIAPISR